MNYQNWRVWMRVRPCGSIGWPALVVEFESTALSEREAINKAVDQACEDGFETHGVVKTLVEGGELKVYESMPPMKPELYDKPGVC